MQGRHVYYVEFLISYAHLSIKPWLAVGFADRKFMRNHGQNVIGRLNGSNNAGNTTNLMISNEPLVKAIIMNQDVYYGLDFNWGIQMYHILMEII
jgi:hypothetical protein